MPHPLGRIAPAPGAIRSTPPCLKGREKAGRINEKQRFWPRNKVFRFFREEALRLARHVHVLSSSGVNRSTTTKAANRHPAGSQGGSRRAFEAGALHLKETAREPCPCGRVIPIGRCVLGTHASRCPAVCAPHRLVFVDRVVGVTSTPHLFQFESPPKKEASNDLLPVVVRFSYSPRHVFAARKLRDGGDRGDRGRGRLTPTDSGGTFLVVLNLVSPHTVLCS